MSPSKKRRQWSSADKMRIVLASMEAGTEISELCRVEGINPTQHYSLKKQLLGGADAVFGKRRGGKDESSGPDPHEKEMNRLRAVIAEISAGEPRAKSLSGNCCLRKV